MVHARIKAKPAEPQGLCSLRRSPLRLLSHMRRNWVRGSVYLGGWRSSRAGVWAHSLSPADTLHRTDLGERGVRKEVGGNRSNPQNWILGTEAMIERVESAVAPAPGALVAY